MPQLLPRLEPASAFPKPRAGPTTPKRAIKTGDSVIQACQNCRRSKVKCDGGRPHCSPCRAKGRTCQYEGVVGQSRKAAVRSRLQALEKFFDALTSRSRGDAEQLLSEIRRTNDLAAVFNVDKLLVSTEKQQILSPLNSPPASLDGATSGDERVFSSDSGGGTPASTFAGNSSLASSPSPAPTSAVVMGSMRLPAFPTLPDHFVQTAMPDCKVIEDATNIFYRCSGELFHIFSHNQIQQLHKVAFYRQDVSEVDKKAALCCVCIIAAVGVTYEPTMFKPGLDFILYDISRHFFAQFLENDSLDAIKVCVIFAMFNIMNKASAALAYLAFGLAMSQRHGLHGNYEDCSLTPEQIKDFRRTWRLLMFFASWLSATLGSPRCDEAPFQSWCNLSDVSIDTSDDVADVVQNEMTKVTMLAADMIRTHLSKKNLTPAGIQNITRDLHLWRSQLPERMTLNNFTADTPFLVKMSMYQVHILYMGALMLVYRRISSQFALHLELGQPVYGSGGIPMDSTVLQCASEGLAAARYCGRIIVLMMGEDGIFRRCWLIIFHAYTSCVVLLHAVAQMQVHQFPSTAWTEDLQSAKVCLDALEFCGEADDVAAQLHSIMSPIYLELAEYAPIQTHSPAATPTADPQDPSYLFRIPDPSGPGQAGTAESLYEMLSRPFRETESPEFGDVSSVGAMWNY